MESDEPGEATQGVEKRDCAMLCFPGWKWKVSVSPGEADVVFGEKERAGPTWMS